MKKITTLALLLTVCFVSTSTAFNGVRKGFVLGGGLGFSPSANYKVGMDLGYFGTTPIDEDGPGLGLNLLIGGAFDEHNMLVYEGNIVGWNSDLLGENVTQGFNGAAWYHYFGPVGKSAFTVTGLGAYVFKVDRYEDNDFGFGMLLGGGYEFSRHWQIGGYLSLGKTSVGILDFEHYHFNILITGIAF